MYFTLTPGHRPKDVQDVNLLFFKLRKFAFVQTLDLLHHVFKEVQNCRVTKSSYETEKRKMM